MDGTGGTWLQQVRYIRLPVGGSNYGKHRLFLLLVQASGSPYRFGSLESPANIRRKMVGMTRNIERMDEERDDYFPLNGRCTVLPVPIREMISLSLFFSCFSSFSSGYRLWVLLYSYVFITLWPPKIVPGPNHTGIIFAICMDGATPGNYNSLLPRWAMLSVSKHYGYSILYIQLAVRCNNDSLEISC